MAWRVAVAAPLRAAVAAALLVAAVAAVAAIARTPDAEERCDDIARRAPLPALQRVATGIWRVPAARGAPDEFNGGATAQLVIVRDGERTWLIGSGPTPAFGAALGCAVVRTTGREVSDVIATRAAATLAMGHAAFARARLWAPREVIAAMHARCEPCRQRLKARIGAAGESLEADAIRIPDRPLAPEGVRAGRLGPFDWRLVEPGPAQPVLMLRHRAARVVIAQGLLWAGDVPDLGDTRSDSMRRSLRALRAFADGARLIGESGEVVGPAEVDRHLRYIGALRREIAKRLRSGDATEASPVPLPAWARLPGYPTRHPLNVQRVWRELETTLFR